MNNKPTPEDLKVWKKFTSSKETIENKDHYSDQKKTFKPKIRKVDLHGLSLENANKVINDFINKCFHNNINRIIVVTGKGLRSNNADNPYVSKNLSILKYSVPEYIKSNMNLMKMIKNIQEADIKDGGSGAFNIYLKKIKE